MVDLSDELKLQFIKTRYNDLTMLVKMQVAVQTTIEAYRQYISGELPEEFKEFVGSDNFKDAFNQAIKASTEILQNLISLTDDIGTIYNIDFRAQLPKTPEQFNDLGKELNDEVQKKLDQQKFD